MHDGSTRKVSLKTEVPTNGQEFLAVHRAVLVTLSGTTAGNEYEIDRDRIRLGRGPGVELAFDDATMSREHAAFEVMSGALRVRDLGSTNGVQVNGTTVLQADLAHGDRITFGEHEFQFILEQRKRTPKAYDLSGG